MSINLKQFNNLGDIMRYILGVTLLILIVGCSTAAPTTSKDYLSMCKSACRGSVLHYQDDSIDCSCKN